MSSYKAWMGIAKRRLPLDVAPSCCWILHRSCVNKSWRDNARMWAKHPRWIFFQMTLSFRVLIGISCFCQHKLTCQLLRINMQNTCNIRGVYSGGSRGGIRAHPPKECSIWYPSTLKLTCFWASSKFEKLRQSKYGCHRNIITSCRKNNAKVLRN